MGCLMNVLPVFNLILLGVVRGQQGAHVQANDNAEQFALLCRIYNVAKNPPINYVDFQNPNGIVNEIDVLNASFADEKQFSETKDVVNSSDAQVEPITTREAIVAQAIIRRITHKAHTILKEIKKNNVTEEIENVKAEFAHVIFGEEANESDLCHGALKGVSGRAEACGNSGLKFKGNSAGKNLIIDFLCVCAQRKDDGIENACKVKVGGNGDKHGWGELGPWGSSSMWASIKKECENLLHQHPSSTKEGYEVLEDFMRHLKSGGLYRWGSVSVEGSNRKEGMLGTSGWKNGGYGTGPVCNGKKGSNRGPGGICVYYGSQSDWDNIDWLKKLKTALTTVDALNNQTATIQHDIQKLQTLLHRAEEIYETTKVITEIKYTVGLTAFPNVSKNMTAYNATRTRSYSYSYHTYFIPMCVLFFL